VARDRVQIFVKCCDVRKTRETDRSCCKPKHWGSGLTLKKVLLLMMMLMLLLLLPLLLRQQYGCSSGGGDRDGYCISCC